ncbi:MAG: hypothetical protein AVDCRST_MAG33-2528 [uncultured Thermomicrobiales bacterium]|uniref:Uncharacterized protein n=1 Tax=uncultured Thermomicrobiales bacterium TaxID=1645740 RepID=A0A6J4VDQ6_9BACT|nr:MAG: hypothetical protein AVDCRST_MAG33-2528 [uncultured Thermomicrobiales bacterium]
MVAIPAFRAPVIQRDDTEEVGFAWPVRWTHRRDGVHDHPQPQPQLRLMTSNRPRPTGDTGPGMVGAVRCENARQRATRVRGDGRDGPQRQE